MAKSRQSMGSKSGGAPFELFNMQSVVSKGLRGLTTKAKTGGHTLFRIVPEHENGVAQPLRDADGDMTRFFEKTTIYSIGTGSKYSGEKCAEPSDCPDMDPGDYPVMALRRHAAQLIDSGDAAINPFLRMFTGVGKFKNEPFPWPKRHLMLQTILYRASGCDGYTPNPKKNPGSEAYECVPHKEFGKVFKAPMPAILFTKGTGMDAIDSMINATDAAGDFVLPPDLLAPGNILAIVTGVKKDDEDRSALTVSPVNLNDMGMPVPNEANLRKAWVDWDKVLRKDTYDEQIKFLIANTSKEFVALVYPDVLSTTRSVSDTPAEEPEDGLGMETQASAPAESEAPAAEEPDDNPWKQGMSSAPASSEGISDATTESEAAPAGDADVDDMAARFAAYQQGDNG